MPSGKKRVSKTTQDERRREIEAIYATASIATKHFINKEGSLVTSIPLGTEEIRRLARLEHSVTKRKVRPGRANRIFAGLSVPGTAREILSEDHLAQRWLRSKSRLQKWRSAGQGCPHISRLGSGSYIALPISMISSKSGWSAQQQARFVERSGMDTLLPSATCKYFPPNAIGCSLLYEQAPATTSRRIRR